MPQRRSLQEIEEQDEDVLRDEYIYGTGFPELIPEPMTEPKEKPSPTASMTFREKFMQMMGQAGAENIAFAEALASPEATKVGQQQALAAGTMGATAALGGGPLAVGLTGAMAEAFPPETKGEAAAVGAGTAADLAINQITKGGGTAAMMLRNYLKGGPVAQTAKRGILEAAAVGGAQLPLIATGESDPGAAAGFMLGQVGAPVAIVGMGRGLASAMGLTNANDVAEALQRVRQASGQFGSKFGVTAESGGFGRKALAQFTESVLGDSYQRHFQGPLQEFVMKGLKSAGGFGEVPITSRMRQEAQKRGIALSGKALDEIQGRLFQTVEKPRITVTPAQKIKVPQGRDEAGRVLPFREETVPAVKRKLTGGDIIGVDKETGKVYSSAPDEALQIPEDRVPYVNVVKLDEQELVKLRKFARRDPGALSAAIGKNNQNLGLAMTLKEVLSESEFQQVQKNWLGDNLIANALVNSSRAKGGIDVRKALGEASALTGNSFMKLDGQALQESWNKLKAQKMIAMLDDKQIRAVDDIVTVVRELDIGETPGISQVERTIGYTFNKLSFPFIGAGMAAASQLPQLAAGAAGVGGFLLGTGVAVRLALANPKTASLIKAAAKGDIGASKTLFRMASANPNIMPVQVGDQIEFVERPSQEKQEEQNPNLLEDMMRLGFGNGRR